MSQENINGKQTFAASCQEYFDLGNRINGKFKIRPYIELHAFEVECEFNESGGKTIMKPIQWNEEGFVFPSADDKRCSEANCFTHDFEVHWHAVVKQGCNQIFLRPRNGLYNTVYNLVNHMKPHLN